MTDRGTWDAWERSVVDELFPKVRGSALVLSLLPGEDPDPKWCLEMGAAIWYGKPIVVVARPGVRVPPELERVAAAVLRAELVTVEGRHALQDALGAFVEDWRRAHPDDEERVR